MCVRIPRASWPEKPNQTQLQLVFLDQHTRPKRATSPRSHRHPPSHVSKQAEVDIPTLRLRVSDPSSHPPTRRLSANRVRRCIISWTARPYRTTSSTPLWTLPQESSSASPRSRDTAGTSPDHPPIPATTTGKLSSLFPAAPAPATPTLLTLSQPSSQARLGHSLRPQVFQPICHQPVFRRQGPLRLQSSLAVRALRLVHVKWLAQ